MILRKPKKSTQGDRRQHQTAHPRKLTAEGWWRKQAKDKGKLIRPKETPLES